LRCSGELHVATRAHELASFDTTAEDFLDAEALRAEVNSPTYLGGTWDRHETAMVDPARLAWGLAAAAEEAGVRIVERTPVSRMRRRGGLARGSGHERLSLSPASDPFAHGAGL
jgi:glycine/D-amino acid oxidase-like deaminating enzyme